MNAHWFEVQASCPDGPEQGEARLRQALRPAGHDVHWIRGADGSWLLAVRVRSAQPEQDLGLLMRQAGLSGYFVPLRWR